MINSGLAKWLCLDWRCRLLSRGCRLKQRAAQESWSRGGGNPAGEGEWFLCVSGRNRRDLCYIKLSCWRLRGCVWREMWKRLGGRWTNAAALRFQDGISQMWRCSRMQKVNYWWCERLAEAVLMCKVADGTSLSCTLLGKPRAASLQDLCVLSKSLKSVIKTKTFNTCINTVSARFGACESPAFHAVGTELVKLVAKGYYRCVWFKERLDEFMDKKATEDCLETTNLGILWAESIM